MYKLLLPYLILLGLISGCTGTTKDLEESKDPEEINAHMSPTEVKVALAEIKTFEYLIHTEGTVVAEEEVEIKSKISGTIASIDYKNGQNVKKGAILVKLENTREALALEKARANYNERLNEYNSQLIGFSKQNLTDTIRNSLRYSTGLSRAEIELKEAELSFRNTVIRAPISGVISNLSVHPGNNVEPSLSLCHIHNPSKMNVEVRILESDIGKIKKGLECRLSPVSYKDNPYPGTIKEINPRIVPETGMGIVAVQVNQPQGLLPGMHVNVEIKVPHEKNILVPSDAVVIRSGKKVVFTTKNGIAAWNYVECGKENGRDIEILNGINDGDTVIISNNLQLAHDAKVKIIQP